jgi:hypothetical protein
MDALKMALFLGSSLLLIGSEVAHSSSPEGLTLTITAPKEVKKGSDVGVEATLTNSSNRIVTLEFISPFCNYDVEVRDSAGNLASDKNPGHCAHLGGTGMDVIVQLKPHESRKDTIWVSAFRDMSKSGKYTIQVTWKNVPWKPAAVKSNAGRIQVASGQA